MKITFYNPREKSRGSVLSPNKSHL